MEKLKSIEMKIFCVIFILIPLVLSICFFLRIDDHQILIGTYNQAEYPNVNDKEIMYGKYQNKWNQWFAQNFPFRKLLTKTYNQWKYSVFSELNGDWIVGKDHYLFSKTQSQNYCEGNGTFTYNEYDVYAQHLYKIQEYLHSKGKAFIYLINPIKAQIYSDYLPDSYQYVGGKYSALKTSDYSRLVEALKKNNVIYYDSTEDLKKLRQQSNYPVFCKTGQHWNIYSCSSVLNDLFSFIGETYKFNLPRIKIDSINEGDTDPIDLDIYSLANIWKGYTEQSYFTTNRSYTMKSDKSLFVFGTSFGEGIFTSLNASSDNFAFNNMVYYEYLTRRIENKAGHISGYTETSPDTDISDLGMLDDIADSDIVIFEENSVLGILEPHKKVVDYLYKSLIENNISMNETVYLSDKNKNITGEGWHTYETWGRWSKKKASSIELRLNYTPKASLNLDMELVNYGNNRAVNIYVNGKYIDKIKVLQQPNHYVIKIPIEYIKDNKLNIVFDSKEDLITPDGVADTSWKIGLGAISFSLKESMED